MPVLIVNTGTTTPRRLRPQSPTRSDPRGYVRSRESSHAWGEGDGQFVTRDAITIYDWGTKARDCAVNAYSLQLHLE
ncbi:hypothetical protein GCM10009647_047040 [Streptomyces sanglieri]